MRPIVLPVLAVVLVAACSAAPAPSAPSANPSNPPSATPSATPSPLPSSSPSVWPTESPFTPSTLPPSPSALPTRPPSPSIAPSGPWSSLHWIDTGELPLGPTEVDVHGWSGGYVAFEQSPGSDENGVDLPVVIRASASTDGVQWSAPSTLKTGFKGNLAISTIVEGPSGLLALGYPYGDTCGGPPTLAALWASPDGRTWQRLPMPKAFAGVSVRTIAGGAAGFIAFGTKSDGSTQAIWTSGDGRSWTSRELPTVSSGTLILDAVASFDDGFVLVGSVLGEEGCGGAAHIKAAAWFSTDGASWTRTSLPGASTDPNAGLAVTRIGSRLVATQSLPTSAPLHAWTSPDGRTWVAVGDVSSDLYWSAVSDGRHTIMVRNPDSGSGPLRLTGIDGTAVATTLTQRGDGPVVSDDGPGWNCAVGPTGLLAVRPDGAASFLGVPG